MLSVVSKTLLKDTSKTFFITGATGFVGSHLVKNLLACNQRVIALGRNPIRLPIQHPHLKFKYFDATNPSSLNIDPTADVVYHIAAHSTPWGDRDIFQKVNVELTKRLVEMAIEAQCKRFVYVSSTAIQFDHKDREMIQESDTLPTQFACEYARSKAEAERIVVKAVQSGLPAITVRARAVFGAGDRTLLPRLLKAAKQRRLPIIGDGCNRIDLTYIDNLIYALVLAAVRGENGGIYTITNDEPILIWELISHISQELQYEPPRIRRVPCKVIYQLTSLSEWLHRFIPQLGEPMLTRYSAGLLSRTQTFDISSAKKQLEYEPVITMKEGVQMTLNSLRHKSEHHAAAHLSLRFFTTGFTTAPSRAITPQGNWNRIRLHAPFAMIEHPTFGISLIDTGYSTRFYDATKRLPARLYRHVTPVVTHDSTSAVSWIKKFNIDPNAVKRIIVTHFHPDHIGGLIDFPNAEIIASQAAWDCVQRSHGLTALLRAILPGHIPHDLEKRSRFVDQFDGPGIGSIERTHDLFGDGSVRLFDISGHAIGQMGVLLQTGTKERVLHAADAAWATATICENLNFTVPFLLFASSVRQTLHTKRMLHQLFRDFPDIDFVTTHCPSLAQKWAFDEQMDSCLAKVETS